MAGTSGPIPNPKYEFDTPITGQWLIHYSRFFNFPSLHQAASSGSKRRKKNTSGTWLSSASMVCLQLLQHQADGVLLVSSQGKIYEQHRISKLQFSWPQVQKFAMRFLSSSDAQAFMCSVKTTLNAVTSGITGARVGSELLSTSNFLSSDGISDSTSQDMSNLNPVGNYWPEMQLSSDHKYTLYTDGTHSTHHSVAGAIPAPPSLTTHLPDTCNDGHRELLNVPELFYPIHKSTEQAAVADPCFFGMLTGLEVMLMELGGDLSL
ncbi:unnamed protein product [Linum tenue]|uniref:Poor homologous synapsis 1 PH domain-containing protein n=1 Tax=Linum tenue TaxID=586396 RepID=A0AAV0ML42_9ROSI|nr:unnamed protein product [Linum tenue]